MLLLEFLSYTTSLIRLNKTIGHFIQIYLFWLDPLQRGNFNTWNSFLRLMSVTALVHLKELFYLYTPWKHQKSTGFLIFSGSTERNQWVNNVNRMHLYMTYYPAGIYLLKVNNRYTRTRCEICSKFIMTSFWCLYC